VIAGEMMQRMSAGQIQRLFFFSRLPLLVFPLLTTLLVWHWGRQLFGGWPGVLLALAMALEPTALGHGAVFKNDLAATFTHLLFWYRAWRLWKDSRWRNAAWLGAALLLALLAKMALLYLLGRIYPDGHPLYFVVALALKVPIPLQVLVLCGAAFRPAVVRLAGGRLEPRPPRRHRSRAVHLAGDPVGAGISPRDLLLQLLDRRAGARHPVPGRQQRGLGPGSLGPG
jgi:hypothetical protein